jgi:arabinose-5-phosphate isomerase
MTRNPVRAHPAMSLAEAARLMEDRPSQLSVLPVVETDAGKASAGKVVGLLRIHDVYQTGMS